jgi:hypothetical protein
VQQLAERYFGSWAAAPGAVTLNTSIQQLAAEPLPQPAAVAAAAAGGAAAVGAVASIGATAAAAAATAVRQLSSGSAVGSIGAKQLGSSGVVWDRTGSSSNREFMQRTAAGPLLAMGYYRPSVTGRHGTAMEVGGWRALGMVCASSITRRIAYWRSCSIVLPTANMCCVCLNQGCDVLTQRICTTCQHDA